jgi:hypothetical protein
MGGVVETILDRKVMRAHEPRLAFARTFLRENGTRDDRTMKNCGITDAARIACWWAHRPHKLYLISIDALARVNDKKGLIAT